MAAALNHLGQEYTHSSGTPVQFEASGATDGLSDVANTVLFRLAQEALTNIGRHAAARQIGITLRGDAEGVTLCIRDDGKGFDAEGIALHPQRGIGLRNMMERMDAIGGRFSIESGSSGTVLTAFAANDS